MAASMLMPKRPVASRALSSKNSNPYLAMNRTTSSPSVATSTSASSANPPPPDLIMPGLYLTDLFTARQVLLPTYHANASHPQIKYVLSILDSSINQPHPRPPQRECLFTQRLIILDDVPDADLIFHLGSACDWIESCLSNADGGVMVHCHMGQSRSAAIVIAYMMRKDKVLLQKALDKVKWRRHIVKPNLGFMKQLGIWEEMEYEAWEDVEEEEEPRQDDAAAEPVVVPVPVPVEAPEDAVPVATRLIGNERQISQEQVREDTTAAETQTGRKESHVEVVVPMTAVPATEAVPQTSKATKTVRRRKAPYETWKTDQEKRTKRYLDNLL